MGNAIYIYIVEHLATIVGFLLAVALVAQVLREPRPTSGALAWVLAIVLVPYVAVPLYLLIGGRKLSRLAKRKARLLRGGQQREESIAERTDAERILAAAGMPPARDGNITVLHHDGQSAYAELMSLLESAEKTIHCMTFILGRDEVGRAIVQTLARKASQGVEVRLLLDGFFWMFFNSWRFVDPLVKAGGKVEIFLPMLPFRRRWSANLRNHRKVVVVDGSTAMVGGMNLARNYMGPLPCPERFLDSAVFVRGPVVADIDAVFLGDWEYATGEEIAPSPMPEELEPGERVQVFESGPDVAEDTLFDVFLTSTMEARRRIWIVTPYFVPSEAIVKALSLQARMGRDVRIVVPLKSNHRIPDLARGPALRLLLRSGARVFAYGGGMVHSKSLLFDEKVAITGSPNLDMRSFYLNFEIALLHYSQEDIEQVGTWMEELMTKCEPMHFGKVPLARQWVEGLTRLMSPLL